MFISLTSMLKNLLLRTVLCHAVVHWLLVTEIMSQSYKGNYDGYAFTSPGLSASRTSNDAQTLCAQSGSNLLEIKSSYVQNLTVRFLRETGIPFADGTLIITNGIRNDFDWIWVNSQGRNSITVSGQGQGFASSFGYINVSSSSLYITAAMPVDARGYICQVAGTFDCTNGFSQNQRCFTKYSSPTMSWFDARNQCLNEGGDLASFDFINDNQELNSTLRGSWLDSSANYWVGIRRQSWTWQISRLEANYTNWANGRPVYVENGGNRCLCLSKNGTDWKWTDCNCSSPFPFVCLTEPITTPSTSTSTRPNTPTISLGLGNATAPSSKASTTEPPISSTDNLGLQLGVGIGVGLGGALIIAATIIVLFIVIRKRGCPSSQTRLLAKTGKYVDAVVHTESPVRRNPENGVNESLKMVSHQSTSPYESLQLEGNTINDRHYQELQIPNRREANGPETSDYEPVRRY